MPKISKKQEKGIKTEEKQVPFLKNQSPHQNCAPKQVQIAKFKVSM